MIGQKIVFVNLLTIQNIMWWHIWSYKTHRGNIWTPKTSVPPIMGFHYISINNFNKIDTRGWDWESLDGILLGPESWWKYRHIFDIFPRWIYWPVSYFKGSKVFKNCLRLGWIKMSERTGICCSVYAVINVFCSSGWAGNNKQVG